MTREEALARFRESRQGAKGWNPFTIFAEGWDACAAAMHPSVRDVRSSGWSGSEEPIEPSNA